MARWFAISRLVGVTGVFIIGNLIICVKVTLQRCHGVLLIGNFQFARKISIILDDLCGVVVHPANRCNFGSSKSSSSSQLPTPIQIDKLEPLLDGYDVELTSILCNGFRFGFSLHLEGSRKSFFAHYLLSFTRQNPEIVDAKLSKELATNRLAGPFDAPR